MKRCTKCNQVYADDNLNFCLTDGAPLLVSYDSESTLVLSQPSFNTPSPISLPSQPQPPSRQGVSPLFAYLAVGLLALVIGGSLVFWLKSDSNTLPVTKNEGANTSSNKEQDLLRQQKEALQDEQASLEKERQRLADERDKLEAQKNKPVETTTYTSVDHPTARINFRSGSVQETISGVVATKRSYVLRAKSGQYLSASVNSSNGCVVFKGGSTSTSYTTTQGDNQLSLVNTCGGQASFSLTVYIR